MVVVVVGIAVCLVCLLCVCMSVGVEFLVWFVCKSCYSVVLLCGCVAEEDHGAWSCWVVFVVFVANGCSIVMLC